MAITVEASAGLVITASADPSVTFSSYTPAEHDLIFLWASSQSNVAANSDPTGWVNPLGSGAEVNVGVATGMACAYHFVTSAEASGVVLTYTATALWGTETGYCHGVALRGVDQTTPIDGIGSAGTDSTSGTTPHTLAGITGSGVLVTGSLVISSVAKDGTGAYGSVPSGWTQLLTTNTNQGKWTGSRNALTTLDTDVTATDITPSAADEYTSITVAFKAAAGAATVERTATLSGTGSLTASGIETLTRTATLAGSGSLSASGTVTKLRTATITGTGTLTASAIEVLPRTASLTGTATLSATGLRTAVRTASLTSVGSLSASSSRGLLRTAQLTATGTLEATGHKLGSFVFYYGSLPVTAVYRGAEVVTAVEQG